MMFSTLPRAALGVLLSLPLISGVNAQNQFLGLYPSNNTESNFTLTGLTPCDALIKAGLLNTLRLPDDPLYPVLVNGPWDSVTRRSPYCFTQPSTPQGLSQVLTALGSVDGAGNWHIAVRSGGHGYDLQNSITQGITIDLTWINSTTYNTNTTIASLSTGARWGAVYGALVPHGVAVTGGRQSIVGVGGLLLGGGVGWTTPRTGFGCDSVVNFEVVLASGDIINANAADHPDLYKALKGGSGNFGIVTRFDMQTFPQGNFTIVRKSISQNEYREQFIDAMVGFANLNSSYDHNAMVWDIGWNPQADQVIMTAGEVNSAGQFNSSAFSAFDALPVISSATTQSLNLADTAGVDAPELVPGTQTIGAGPQTIVNDVRIVRYAFQAHDELVTYLNNTLGAENFNTISEWQPLNNYWQHVSKSKGGNVLGLERYQRNRLYYSLGATFLKAADVATYYTQVEQKIAQLNTNIQAYAASLGGDDPFIYLPYAKAQQEPLGGYGLSNVNFLKQVAQKYDPEGFFQKRVNGGFKISYVN